MKRRLHPATLCSVRVPGAMLSGTSLAALLPWATSTIAGSMSLVLLTPVTIAQNPIAPVPSPTPEAQALENPASPQSTPAPKLIAPPETMATPAAIPNPVATPSTPVTPSPSPMPTDSVKNDAVPSPGVKILAPVTDAVVDVPATPVVVQFPLGQQIELRVDGRLVDAALVGRTETDTKNQVITQTWYGVSLKEGSNTVTATIVGSSTPAATIQVQVRGAPTKLTLKTAETKIPADGRSLATVQGELLDELGNRSNRDALITLSSTAGEFVGTDASIEQPGFQVKAHQGEFSTQLKAGLEAKSVTIRAFEGNLEAFTPINFETSLRTSLVTGVVDLRLGKRGTDFYRGFREFLPLDRDYSTQLDLRTAIFATGRVGNWLLTGAHNNERPLNKTCDDTVRLFREQQLCDRSYFLYGDSSQSTVVAPSIDSVYLKAERTSPVPNAGTDYAMWGDYNTEEFAGQSQEFTAITRQLHGLKSNYNFGNLQLSGFFANNVEGFQRDTIAPDGTSGSYFLSRRLLIEGSENIFIETEELDRPGTVIERRSLSRGTDYEIDYDRGTLVFREPMLRTDVSKSGETLVRRIIVTYQFEETGSDTNLYGGRLRYHLARGQAQSSWVGATYLKENQGRRDFELYGADGYFSLGSQFRLAAEYAHANSSSDALGQVSGSAYRLELDGKVTPGIQGRAYYRFAESGFANNATLSFVPGQTRYGAQATATVSPTTNLRFQYDHEQNKGTAPQPLLSLGDLLAPRTELVAGSAVDNSLTTISAGVDQKLGSALLSVDWLHRDRDDRLNPNTFDTTSDQLRSRFTFPINPRLSFLAQNETTLSAQTDAVYSDRTLLGLNWAVMPGVNLQVAEQFYTRGQFAGQSIPSVGITGDYRLGRDTTLSSRYTILGGANQVTTQGAIGLNQKLSLAPGLRMNLAYEHVFSSFSSKRASGTQFLQPFSPGRSSASVGLQSGDSYGIGLEYSNNPGFQASTRLEHRTSTGGSNTVFSAGALGKVSPELTALFRYQQTSAANQRIEDIGDTASLRLGLAYRNPRDDRFNGLLRYEYRKNPATIPESILFSSGTSSDEHLLALEGIYAPDWRWELYGKFALRSSTSHLAEDLVGTSLTTLAQARLTHRLGYRWDVTGEARWIGQGSTNFSETGLALEAGYYLTPNLRLSGGYSFGRVRDRDFGDSRSAGGFYLGLTAKVNELFSGFGLQKGAIPDPRVQPSTLTSTEATMKELPGLLAPTAPATPAATAGSESTRQEIPTVMPAAAPSMLPNPSANPLSTGGDSHY